LNVTLNQFFLILFATYHMSLTANCLHLPWMISSSLKGAYEKWFFFQLWVNKLAMKVTFIELRNKNLTVSHHPMALYHYIFLQSLITPIWYIDTYHIWIILVMVMSYFDRFSLDSHLLLKKVEIEFGVTTINSDC